jgi:choline monooxygenase
LDSGWAILFDAAKDKLLFGAEKRSSSSQQQCSANHLNIMLNNQTKLIRIKLFTRTLIARRFICHSAAPCNYNKNSNNVNSINSSRVNLASVLQTFDPSIPVASASTLPSVFYNDPTVYESELDKVFNKSWLYVGHIDSLAKIGDFITGTIGNKPYIVARDDDNNISAHYNVCIHHAMIVETKCSGNRSEFQCGYHGWKYFLNGKLKLANKIKGIENFKASKMSLVPIQTRVVGPLIFIKLDNQLAEDNADHLVEFDKIFSETNYKQLKFVRSLKYKLNCNWKVFVDNYLDGGYHVNIAHPDLAVNLNMKDYEIASFKKYSIQQAAASNNNNAESRVHGKAVYGYLYPNLMLNRYGCWLDSNLVIPTGLHSCEVIIDYYIDPSKLSDQQFIDESIKSSDKVQDEDIGLCESVQRGLSSGVYSVGRYSPLIEFAMHDFHKQLHHDLTQS